MRFVHFLILEIKRKKKKGKCAFGNEGRQPVLLCSLRLECDRMSVAQSLGLSISRTLFLPRMTSNCTSQAPGETKAARRGPLAWARHLSRVVIGRCLPRTRPTVLIGRQCPFVRAKVDPGAPPRPVGAAGGQRAGVQSRVRIGGRPPPRSAHAPWAGRAGLPLSVGR